MSDKLQDAWARVTAQLAEAGARIEALTEGRDPVERAEGYRFLTRVLSAMIDFSIEADCEQPAFVRVMTPTRKFYGDCSDTMYHRATLRSGLGYRISGQRGGCIYLAFCVYGLRGKRNAILTNVADAELVFEPDGSFEIILSAERPEGAANWLRLEPAAATLVARQYFADSTTETPARFNIETLQPIGPPSALEPNEVAHRLRALGESMTRTLRATEAASAEWIQRPNEISFDSGIDGLASLFCHAGQSTRGQLVPVGRGRGTGDDRSRTQVPLLGSATLEPVAGKPRVLISAGLPESFAGEAGGGWDVPYRGGASGSGHAQLAGHKRAR